MAYAVELRTIEAEPVIAMHRTVPIAHISEAMQQAIPATWSYAASHGAMPVGTFARYYSVPPGDVECDIGVIVGAPLAGEGDIEAKALPAGEVAYVLYTGPYDGMEPAYRAIEEWMAANGRVAGGAPWERYLTDPSSEPDPAKWQTAIYWPLA